MKQYILEMWPVLDEGSDKEGFLEIRFDHEEDAHTWYNAVQNGQLGAHYRTEEVEVEESDGDDSDHTDSEDNAGTAEGTTA